jgi:hypothetical protein
MTDLRERLQTDKVKLSLKSRMIEYRTFYLSEFLKQWRRVPAAVVVLAMEELERENFLTIGTGRYGATMLRLKETP